MMLTTIEAEIGNDDLSLELRDEERGQHERIEISQHRSIEPRQHDSFH